MGWHFNRVCKMAILDCGISESNLVKKVKVSCFMFHSLVSQKTSLACFQCCSDIITISHSFRKMNVGENEGVLKAKWMAFQHALNLSLRASTQEVFIRTDYAPILHSCVRVQRHQVCNEYDSMRRHKSGPTLTQVIIWTNVDLSWWSVAFTLEQVLKLLCKISLKIKVLKLLSHIPRANELNDHQRVVDTNTFL